FAVAVMFDRTARKRNAVAGQPPERLFSTRRVVIIGVFSAIATILHYLDFPVFFAPGFYKLDFSELPPLIAGFAFGPVAGVMIEFIKILLKLLLKGTSTAFVGDLANFVVGCSFVLPATVLYQMKKSRKTALLSCILGTVVITVFGSVFNAVYLLPAFSALYGMPMDALIGAGTAINPRITDVTSFVILAVAPMNLLKGTMISVITLLVYKKLSPILKKE
ncbi:MAG: ECF transporter S component, partial [Butyrivibrio sp.]|nr:ECF transporter S component [Butyrivibrio sp.]